MNIETELLCELLKCGYKDLERLKEVLAIAMKLDISLSQIVEYTVQACLDPLDINDLIYSSMWLTLEELSRRIEKTNKRIAERLLDHEILVNYFDSWFNIEALDNLGLKEIERLTPEQIVERVLKELEGRGNNG